VNIFHLSNREIGLLIYIAQKHAIDHKVEITTTEVAKVFNMSQQSASRYLLKLAAMDFILWESGPRGSNAQLTDKGIETLHNLRFELEKAIHPDKTELVLRGVVFTGFGEGKYYMSQPSYVKSFKKTLGFVPYPGTLNVRIDPNDVEKLDLIRGSFPKIITGFKEKGRSFGDVLCYSVKLFDSDEKAAIIVPRRTHYGKNIAEVVSDINIRGKFNLKDGDEIIIRYSLKKVDKR